MSYARSLCALGFVLAVSGFAQDPAPLTWDGLLGSVQAEPSVQASTQKVALLEKPEGPGYWNAMELRYSADGLDMREHKFEARISPYAWGERSALNAQLEARLHVNNASRDLTVSKVLNDRYQLGLQWIIHQREKVYHEALSKVYADRVQVEMSLTGTERFDPEDLVESQQTLAELQGDLLGDLNDIEETETILHKLVGAWTVIDLDTANLLTVADLKARVDSLPSQVDSTLPSLRISQARLHLAESRFQLEQTRSTNIVSYGNIGYDLKIPKAGKTGPTALESMSAGVGIQIPIFDGRKQDLQRRQLDLLDEKSTFLDDQWDLERKLGQLRMEIGSLMAQKAVLDSFAARVDAGNLFTDYAVRAGTDPLLLLKARATSLQSAWRSERLRYDIYASYLSMLEITGVLARDPGTNHLKRKV